MNAPWRGTLLLTALAMMAFAGNSLLCRAALRPGAIDATTFALVRVLAGAAVLLPLALRTLPLHQVRHAGSWPSAVMLAAYAVAFSLAYRALDASTGTLLLFGAVQVTMLGTARLRGERPPRGTWFGFLLATAGLGILLLPGVHAPDVASALLMVVAGVAWGGYSLRGRGAHDATAATTANFVRALPLCALASLVALTIHPPHATGEGLLLAILSGAITSGLGYVVWYATVRSLTATAAATAQLVVPVLAAFGGVLLFDEALTLRLALAAPLVLGGAGLAIVAKRT